MTVILAQRRIAAFVISGQIFIIVEYIRGEFDLWQKLVRTIVNSVLFYLFTT